METKDTSRLDRIEKELELFITGMKELRAAQLKTDEQIAELKEAQLKTDAMQRKTDAQILELKEAQKKSDERQKKSDERLDKVIKKLDAVGKQLGDLGLVQGEVAEDLFYRNVKYIFRNKGVRFGKVLRNLKRRGAAEYDIVAADEDSVLVIEVKNKLSARMVDKFVNRKLPAFRRVFPEYGNRRLSGGIGALIVKDEVGRYAEDAGLYVLTQSDDGGAVLFNRKDFTPKVFE